MKWNFTEKKKKILKDCSEEGWDLYGIMMMPITEETIDETIKVAHNIQSFFEENSVEIRKPILLPCVDGSIDLSFGSFEEGYGLLFNYNTKYGESLYGDNEVRDRSRSDIY